MDISLLEFIVYGFVTYFSLAMLIITTIRTPMEKTKKLALVRAMYMLPGIICAILLAGSGTSVFLGSTTSNTNQTETFQVLNNVSQVVTLNSNTTTSIITSSEFVLQNPVWVTFHYMIALIMIIFIFIQVFTMLTARE